MRNLYSCEVFSFPKKISSSFTRSIKDGASQLVFGSEIILVKKVYELFFRDLAVTVGIHCIERGLSVRLVDSHAVVVCFPFLERDHSVIVQVQSTEHNLKEQLGLPALCQIFNYRFFELSVAQFSGLISEMQPVHVVRFVFRIPFRLFRVGDAHLLVAFGNKIKVSSRNITAIVDILDSYKSVNLPIPKFALAELRNIYSHVEEGRGLTVYHQICDSPDQARRVTYTNRKWGTKLNEATKVQLNPVCPSNLGMCPGSANSKWTQVNGGHYCKWVRCSSMKYVYPI